MKYLRKSCRKKVRGKHEHTTSALSRDRRRGICGILSDVRFYDVEDSTKDIEVPIYDYNDLWDLILQDYYQQLDVIYSLDLENKVVVDTQFTLF